MYGLQFTLPQGGGIEAPPVTWPEVRVDLVPASTFAGDDDPFVLSDDRAAMSFREGRLDVVRDEPFVVRIAARGLGAEAFVHPYLSLPAAVINHWLGHVSLHAGAVLVDGRAVLVTAPKEGGKSTTMAALAARGASIITDDLLVVRDGHAMAGPRSVDLREEAARAMGGRSLGVIGARERWRVPLAQIAPEHRITAIVELAWGDDVTLERVRGADGLDVLVGAAALGPAATDPARLLDLLTLPTYRLRRPRDLARLPEAIDSLLEL